MIVIGRGGAVVRGGVVVVEVPAEPQLLLRKENNFSRKAFSLGLHFSRFSNTCLSSSFWLESSLALASSNGSQVIGLAERSNIAVTYFELDSGLDASSVMELGEDVEEAEEELNRETSEEEDAGDNEDERFFILCFDVNK